MPLCSMLFQFCCVTPNLMQVPYHQVCNNALVCKLYQYLGFLALTCSDSGDSAGIKLEGVEHSHHAVLSATSASTTAEACLQIHNNK